MLSYFILALCVSIDSFGIGITYGLKNTKIPLFSKIILFLLSIFFTTSAIYIGELLMNILPNNITKFIGSLILVSMGIWIIYQALSKKEKLCLDTNFLEEEKIYTLFIKFLGITIQIIRNPISSDLDNSKKIDKKEALFLGFAMSIDSLCVGIGSSIIGFNSVIFPILVSTFQLFFLSLGRYLGQKISSISIIPENIWNVMSGVLLICIAIVKFFV